MGNKFCPCSSKNDRNISPVPVPMGDNIAIINKQYNDIKVQNIIYYNDIEVQEKYISNYKTYVSELSFRLSELNNNLNISYDTPDGNEPNINEKNENNYLLNDLDEINNKINEFHYLIENQKVELKNLENNYRIVQEQFNNIKIKINKGKSINNKYISLINEQLNESKEIEIKIKNNQMIYNAKRKDIEDYIKNIQFITKEKIDKIKNKRKNIKNSVHSEKNGKIFLKSSMLLEINDFSIANDKLKTKIVFKEKENKDNLIDEPNLLMKNWYETCYIYDEYDIHDITFDLKAVGLLKFTRYTKGFFNFFFYYDGYFDYFPEYNIDTLEIDGKKSEYKYENYKIEFDISLQNLESNKVHIIFRESPEYEKMTEEEKNFRKVYHKKYYGLSEKIAGENAKFILKNKSNFEIINFNNEFLIKTKDEEYKEYQWGGKVPEKGKKTLINFSKKEGLINFEEVLTIDTFDDSPIQKTIVEVPFYYIGGNNYINDLHHESNQTKDINMDKQKKVYNIKYIKLNTNKADFHFKGEFKNFCDGEWNIDLTDEEIESLIPPDFKNDKAQFNKIANDIIKEYDQEHQNDDIKVLPVVKIGKWIEKNIEYYVKYAGMNEITAMQTYDKKKGVCDHKTKLFNALMYSLGYQVLYAMGYAMNKKNTFSKNDEHAWSLIKIDGKWLPFDATWGIFSGKLPVTHVFKKFGLKGPKILEELSDPQSRLLPDIVKGKIS